MAAWHQTPCRPWPQILLPPMPESASSSSLKPAPLRIGRKFHSDPASNTRPAAQDFDICRTISLQISPVPLDSDTVFVRRSRAAPDSRSRDRKPSCVAVIDVHAQGERAVSLASAQERLRHLSEPARWFGSSKCRPSSAHCIGADSPNVYARSSSRRHNSIRTTLRRRLSRATTIAGLMPGPKRRLEIELERTSRFSYSDTGSRFPESITSMFGSSDCSSSARSKRTVLHHRARSTFG